MKNNPARNAVTLFALELPVLLLALSPNDQSKNSTSNSTSPIAASDGPTNQGTEAPRQDGNANAGRDVFRFETFGNEGFWTDAVRLPAGMKAAKVTPLKALQLGLSVDVEAVDPEMQKELMKQLKEDPTGKKSALLNDPSVTEKLIAANAVIGFAAKGDKVGATCALCHTITDGSVFSLPNGGSIGHREDGRANHNLDPGAIFATASTSRALYPVLQLTLKANGAARRWAGRHRV